METRPQYDSLKRRAERGSAILYVLIAVAMFAALSFAVSNINRQGGNADISEEVSNMTATEIIQYATAIKNAVRNAEIEGCADTDISFETPLEAGYTNTNNPPDDCKIFNAEGQNITWQDPSPKANDGSTWLFMGNVRNADIGDLNAPELAIFLPRVNRKVCQRLNEAHGLAEDPLAGMASLTITKFTGTYTLEDALGTVSPAHAGKRAFCFEETDTGDLYYFNVLITR